MEQAENTGLFGCIGQSRSRRHIVQDIPVVDIEATGKDAAEEAGPAFPMTPPSEHFCASFLSDAENEEPIARWLHPEGVVCPNCKRSITDPTIADRFYHLQGGEWKECRCPDCGKRFTPWTGTLFDGAHNKRAAFLTLALAGFHVDPKFIARLTGQHIDTVRNWIKVAQAIKDSNV